MCTFVLNVLLNEIVLTLLQNRTLVEFMYEILFYVLPPNQYLGSATGTTSTLYTPYYTKITLLNNFILTILLLIVNVHIKEIVSRALRSLICISIGPQLTLHSVFVYEYSNALLSAHPNIFDIPLNSIH